MSTNNDSNRTPFFGIIISLIGIVLLSFDVVLIRLAAVSAWDSAFWRGAFIAVTTSTVLFAQEKTHLFTIIKYDKSPILVSGILWALSGIFFVMGVKYTAPANSLVLISLSPLFAAIAAWIFIGEKVTLSTFFMMLLSLVGVYVIFMGKIEGGTLLGNFFALLSPIALGTNLAYLRKHTNINRAGTVITGGIISAVIASFFAAPFSLPPYSYIYLALLGLIVIPIPQLLLSTGTRYIPAAQVAFIMMIETPLGMLYVWALIGEVPAIQSLFGGLLAVSGVIINIFLNLKKDKKILNKSFMK